MAIDEFLLRRFEEPDEVREFPLGRFELIEVGGMTLGRATYEPGWRWSDHVGESPTTAARSSTSGSWSRAAQRSPGPGTKR